jgi:hypothetical protein
MAVLGLLVLAGCGAAAPGPVPPARQGVSFVPDANGLGVQGRATRIDFGRSPKGVIPVLEREVGRGADMALTGCPAGVVRRVDYDGLELLFTAERFVGWRQEGATAGQACA